VCDISFTVAQHDFVRTFHALRDLRAADIVLGLPWLDDEQAGLKFGAERLFTLMDGTAIENQVIERHPECLLLLTRVLKSMRKSSRATGRTAEFFTVNLAAAEQQPPSEFRLSDELSDDYREDLREMPRRLPGNSSTCGLPAY
jgi:hypothetical protein